MLNCNDTTRLLSEGQDRELGAKERLSVKLHTMMCSGCRNFGHQMHTLRDLTRSYAQGAGDPTESSEGPDDTATEDKPE